MPSWPDCRSKCSSNCSLMDIAVHYCKGVSATLPYVLSHMPIRTYRYFCIDFEAFPIDN